VIVGIPTPGQPDTQGPEQFPPAAPAASEARTKPVAATGKRRTITPKTPGAEAPAAAPAADPAAPAASEAPAATPEVTAETLQRELTEPARRNAPDELPDESEIDPHTITRPVLTKQGYVMPAEKPKG